MVAMKDLFPKQQKSRDIFDVPERILKGKTLLAKNTPLKFSLRIDLQEETFAMSEEEETPDHFDIL